MKKILKKTIMIFMSLLIVSQALIFSSAARTSVQSVFYSRSAALQYASEHWDDGVGQCAAFVSACLQAGGLPVNEPMCSSLWTVISSYGTINRLITEGEGTAQERIKLRDNPGIAEAGDVIFYVCDTCGGLGVKDAFAHVVFCGGSNSEGYITAYAHNAAKNNKPVYVDLGHSGHPGHRFSLYSCHISDTGEVIRQYDLVSGAFTYDTVNGIATITRCSEVPEELVIPEAIDGHPVLGIGESAFSGNTGITKVVIPSTVSSIGENAFSGCTGITAVEYKGTGTQWSQISVSGGNECLTSAPRTCADPPAPPSGPGGSGTDSGFSFSDILNFVLKLLPYARTALNFLMRLWRLVSALL